MMRRTKDACACVRKKADEGRSFRATSHLEACASILLTWMEETSRNRFFTDGWSRLHFFLLRIVSFEKKSRSWELHRSTASIFNRFRRPAKRPCRVFLRNDNFANLFVVVMYIWRKWYMMKNSYSRAWESAEFTRQQSRRLPREWRPYIWGINSRKARERRDKIRISDSEKERLSKLPTSRHFCSKWWITDEEILLQSYVYIERKMRSGADTRVHNT